MILTNSGCIRQIPPPLSENTRAQLGNMGIVSTSFVNSGSLSAFAKSREGGAARGTAEGAVAGGIIGAGLLVELGASTGISATALAGAPVIGPAVIVIVAAGALIGAGIGAYNAIPRETAEKIEEMLNGALAELRLEESLLNNVLETASQQTMHRFILIDRPMVVTSEDTQDYRPYSDKGIKTLLELAVLKVSFDGKKGKDPLLSFRIDMRARVISTADSKVLYENEFKYRSARRNFTQWANNDAKIFIDEINIANQRLSEKVLEEIFLVYNIF